MRTLGKCWWRERLVFSMFYNTTKYIMEEGVKIKGICNGKLLLTIFCCLFHLKKFLEE